MCLSGCGLEMRVAYQDKTIAELDEVIQAQYNAIDRLNRTRSTENST